MDELAKIQKIIDAYPEKCPYCFKPLMQKIYKPSSSASPYCSSCGNFIDAEWDYLHAIAQRVKNYIVLDINEDVLDFRKKIKR